MTIRVATFGIIAFALSSGSAAVAADCTGSTARVGVAPVIVKQVEDGPTPMLLQNTGLSTTLSPESEAGQAWQHCSGMWVAQPDGSGAGAGYCYAVDDDGDIQMISWEGANGKGTWANTGGTGKNAGRTGGDGTFTTAKSLPNGLTTGFWTGPCG